MAIDKRKILNELRSNVQKELDSAREAFKTTKSHATEQEMKSEGKYDTRSIEAGYLAGAQMKRVDELELDLGLLDEINLEHMPTDVSVGSLVEIQLGKMVRHYFISSTSGGTLLNIDNNPILVVSAFSPIGSGAIGLSVGDEFEVESSTGAREYKIISIC